MDRRRFIVLSMGGTLASSLLRAQPRTPRIAYLTTVAARTEFEDAFVEGLREHGYVDGKSIVIDFRWNMGDAAARRTALADLVERKVDVVVATGVGITRAARDAAPTIPIVLTTVGDPVAAGLAASLSRPGGNITGYSMYTTELSRKRVDVFAEAIPGLRRIGALYNGAPTTRPASLVETEAAGPALGIEVLPLPTTIPDGIRAVFAAAGRDRLQGVVIVSDPATITHRDALGAAAIEHRMPTMFANKQYLKGGGLMSYGPDILLAFRRSAYFVDRLLKGAKAGEMPIELPIKFELVVSRKTASLIGLTLPRSLLERADLLID